MKVEQPRELNPFVDNSMPLTWSYRWQRFRVVVPLLLFYSICLIENALFRAWLEDRLDTSMVPKIVVGAFAPLVVFFLIMEGEIRMRHRSKRILEIKDKGISIRPSRGEFVAWDLLRAIRFEPVLNHFDLTKLTIEYAAGRKSKLMRSWSMVLSRAEQAGNTASELDFRRQTGQASFELSHLTNPAAPQDKYPNKLSLMPVWLGLLGLYLMLHGAPLLLIGVTDNSKKSEPRPNKIQIAPKRAEQIDKFIFQAGRMNSVKELNRFIIVSGSALTAIGVCLFAWGTALTPRTKKAQGNR